MEYSIGGRAEGRRLGQGGRWGHVMRGLAGHVRELDSPHM